MTAKGGVYQANDRLWFVITAAIAAVLLMIVGSSRSVFAAPPSGFTCLGSALPEEGGVLGYVPKLIKDKNLEEIIPPEWQAKEKWGTSVLPTDEKRGYLVFSRHYADKVYYYSVPNNRAEELSLFAGLGEYEPVSFSVYPLKEIKGIKVSVTDLKNEKGAVIRNENLDIRLVRSVPFARGEKNYVMEPLLLEKFKSIDLSKGKVVQIWMTFYAPKDAVPGVYTGKIKLESGQAQPHELKLTVRVLPIRLQEPRAAYGMCFYIPGKKYMHPENLDKYFIDMREHNLNSMWTWPDSGIKKEGDKVVYDFSKFGVDRKGGFSDYYGNSLDEIMAGYLKAGFRRPWICGTLDSLKDLIVEKLGYNYLTPEFDAAYLDYVRQLLAHAREKNWPEFSLHPKDEPSNIGYEEMNFALHYYKLLKENFPEVKTMADGCFYDQRLYNWQEDRFFAPYIDIMCYQSESKGDMEFCRQNGLQYYFYNQGATGKEIKGNRDRWGVYVNKTDCDGRFHWVYTWWQEPNLPGDWFGYILPAPDGPIPSVGWEAVREGIDDNRYITTLSNLIEKARASGQKELINAASEARRCIDTILSPVPAGLPEYTGPLDPKVLAQLIQYYSDTPSVGYDLNRWRLAERIILLESLLSGKTAGGLKTPLLPVDDKNTLGMWHFDEGRGTIVSDDSHIGKSHNNDGAFGTIGVKGGGNPFWSKGIFGNGLQFTWLTAPVVIPLKNGLDPKGFTYEAWINYSQIAKEGSYFGSLGDRWSVRLTPEGKITLLMNIKDSGWKELSGGLLYANRWCHTAVTYDGNFAKLYVDGGLVDYLACSGEIGGTSDKLFIGSNLDGSGGRFFGRVDEVRLSNVARSFNLPWE